MATTLLQARVGAGKTEAALKNLSAVISNPDKPFMKVWVLLATTRQEVAFRQRLIDLQDGRGVYFNAEFFNFYDLNARLLNLAGQPPRRINEPARLGLMRQVLYSLRDDNKLPTFTPILRTSGFLRVVADLIYELKQNRVFPETYLDAVQSQKDRELALIYDRYQSLMQDYDLVDREGEGWLALEAIENSPQLATDVDLLLVDGYDQFTPVQSALLAQLSSRIDEVLITLTAPPGDAQSNDAPVVIGRRFIDARNNLKAIHETLAVPFAVDTIDEPLTDRHPDLVALAQNIFSDTPKVTVTDGFTMVEAPEAPEEVQAVWRKIKRLLLSGVRPDDILVAVRDWGRYYPHMERYTYAYDLPVLLHYGDPLANNPAIAVLMTTLMLAGNDPESPSAFRRRPLLDVLRSPYIAVPGITDEMIDALDLISHEQQVLGGRQNWLNAIDAASDEYYDEDGELQEAIIDLEFGMEISVALEAFFEKITPDQSATHQDYVAWLEDLIGEDPVNDPDDRVEDLDVETIAIQPHDTYTLNIPTCIRNLPTTAHADRILRRDVAAMNQFKEILRGILTVQEFLRGVLRDSTKQLSWRDFLADLQTGVKNDRPVQRHPGRSGRVLVTTATDARGLPHDHMFILGLSEGIFPADIPEDPLYLDTERKALSERGVTLQTQAERADDSGIFYELISQARQSLTLSRPHVRDGKQWVESHLWRMSKDVFADLPVQHIGIGEIPTADTIATLAEAEITLAHRLSSNTRDETTRQLHQWITQTDAQRWQRINQGRTLETGRLSSGSPYDPATGYIQHPDILEIIADTIDTDYTWSATRLSSYGACPYRFFASYMLKLSSLDELEEGMDVLQRGTLNHSILEKTYRAIRDEGIVITPDNRLDAIDILHEIATEVFENAPRDLNFRPTALWVNEQDVILRQLEKLVEQDFSSDAPLNKFMQSPDGERRIYRLEQRFGGEKYPLDIPLDDTGEHTIRVRGSIDRIDIVDDDRLVVVDYKSGTTGIAVSQMEQGKNFQMMVYLLALHTILQQEKRSLRIAGGMFWHIRNQKASGKMSFSDNVTENESIQLAQQHITNYLHNMREGDFRVHPTAPSGNKCTSYCEFYQLCRLANTNQYKKDA